VTGARLAGWVAGGSTGPWVAPSVIAGVASCWLWQGGQDGPVRPGEARPGHLRRSTVTSWRMMRISTFLAAALRVSSPSQPNSLSVVRYSRRNNTTGDHVMIT
jgi:hypothetical protein